MFQKFRWRFIVHGGIDGYSRMIVYLRCSTNNLANTVLDSFLSAVSNFGLPSRVRSDKGTENVDIAYYMLRHPLRGPDRGSHICGAAFITKGLSAFGEMCFLGVSMYFIFFLLLPLFHSYAFSLSPHYNFFMAFFMKWKNVGCLIHQMRFIYLHSTLYTFPELTETWKYLHKGITELQFPLNGESLLCSCGYLVLQLALIGVLMTIGTR